MLDHRTTTLACVCAEARLKVLPPGDKVDNLRHVNFVNVPQADSKMSTFIEKSCFVHIENIL